MALLLRIDESEGVVRSVGDPPNGIVATADDPDGPGYVLGVSATFDPLREGIRTPAHTALQVNVGEARDHDDFRPVAVPRMVEACQSGHEAYALWLAVSLLCASVARNLPATVSPDSLRHALDLADELHRALLEAGYLRERPS